MCDRKKFLEDKRGIPEDMMNRLIDHAVYELKNEMVIEDGPLKHKDSSVKELGKALVKANKLGLRVIKGGK